MALAFVKLKWALALYIIYIVCVPYCNLKFMGFTLGLNLINIVLFAALIVDSFKCRYKIRVKEMYPFVLFFIFTFVMMFVQNKTPLSDQYTEWKGDVLKTLIAPIAIFSIARWDPSVIKWLKWGLIIAMLISGIYAVYLLFMPSGINPYLILMSELNDVEYNMAYSDDAGRVIQRIFSTFSHPMMWSLFLCLFLITFWNLKKDTPNLFFYGLLGLDIIDLVFCGVRTGIAALFVVVAYVIWKYKKFKYFLYAVGFGIFFLFALSFNDKLYDYFYSTVNSSKTENKGSDLDMRITQWEGCLEEVGSNVLTGNGYRYTSYYESKFGPHPKAYTFESLIFVIYTNWGVLGFLLWGVMFYMIFKQNHSRFRRKWYSIHLDALLLLYIIFSTVTGEYHFLSWFALFYAISYVYFDLINIKLLTGYENKNISNVSAPVSLHT